MAVYVDNVMIPARVGRISARWCHLIADSQEELHAFAESIGLKRSWFQPGKPFLGKPSRHWHYDVTESKRRLAVAKGAQEIDFRQYREIIDRRDGIVRADG